MTEETLFRQEAMQFAGQSFLGRVTLDQPLSLLLLSLFFSSICVIALVFLFLGEYARKETVPGYLDARTGVVGVFAQEGGGVVEEIFVANGQWVDKGMPLLRFAYPQTTPDGEDSVKRALAELQQQKSQLRAQAKNNLALLQSEKLQLQQRAEEIAQEIEQQQHFAQLQTSRIDVNDQLLVKLDSLRATGGISESRWLQATADKIEQEKEMTLARQRLLKMVSSSEIIQQDLQQHPAKEAKQQLQLDLQLSSIDKQIAELSLRQARLIRAPISGQVSGLQAKLGMTSTRQVPLLSLVSSNADLEGVLLIPSKAIGFLETGQPVRMMFDAFPHQQFGTQPASVISISPSPISATDLHAPVRVNGPVFVVRTSLAKDHISAMGELRPLQPGMLLRADIVLEKRSLLTWLLEPLYNLRGRG